MGPRHECGDELLICSDVLCLHVVLQYMCTAGRHAPRHLFYQRINDHACFTSRYLVEAVPVAFLELSASSRCGRAVQ